MTGIFQHSLDAKGRVFIPACLREEFGETFHVTISDEKCLTAHTPSSWNRSEEKYRSLPMNQHKKIRPLFSHAAKCEVDGQGRILLPKILRDFAGLTKDVTIVGFGDYSQIWDTDTWTPIGVAETTPENIAKVLEELDF
jgi:MraZ protein